MSDPDPPADTHPDPAAGVFRLGPKITAFPVVNGSGDFAVAVRQALLNGVPGTAGGVENAFDCLAVPLPPSFREAVEEAVGHLPAVSAVVQREPRDWAYLSQPGGGGLVLSGGEEEDEDDDPEGDARVSFVPVDPCQPIVAAVRGAVGEHLPRAFIDLETDRYEPFRLLTPDPYALKRTPPEKFAAAVVPALPRPAGQLADRCRHMAGRLQQLEKVYDRIFFPVPFAEWPWVREAYLEVADPLEDDHVEAPDAVSVAPRTLAFLLGELPFVTALYERARAELDPDESLAVDGVKALLLEARDRYVAEYQKRARPVTPKLMATFFHYARNLSLIERRLTPDLYTLAIAAKQIFGDAFAVHVVEAARDYTPRPGVLTDDPPYRTVKFAPNKVQLPDGEVCEAVSRLPGPPTSWRTIDLTRRAPEIDQQTWKQRWNPFRQCSYPPEDRRIETFRTHVKDVALKLIGADLARSEKFSSSLRDGLDVRETLRNWHTGDLYVKVMPPVRGGIDSVVMLFDSPADPRDYPWRVTWHAEHADESTLALFASDWKDDLVGPGIARATYGGCLFLFPPRPVVDIWRDPRLDFCDTLEERTLAAACLYAEEPHVAVLSDAAPGAGFRRLARKFRKKLVHVPLGRMGSATVERLRTVHVLNGKEVRSFAQHFIREA